ncbi:MAG: rRNA maturation RNase YbeY, partial [Desulfobaccales bacterium]|nr:rRNA maturation RNase YbeY [Desulfobaccales bacterium]
NAPTAGGPPPLLGEVVISVETTVRQAKESGWATEELFDFYLIHGILQLLGYEHGNTESEAQMTDKTWELMHLLYPGLEDMKE